MSIDAALVTVMPLDLQASSVQRQRAREAGSTLDPFVSSGRLGDALDLFDRMPKKKKK
jgi:hypothetical protein